MLDLNGNWTENPREEEASHNTEISVMAQDYLSFPFPSAISLVFSSTMGLLQEKDINLFCFQSLINECPFFVSLAPLTLRLPTLKTSVMIGIFKTK